MSFDPRSVPVRWSALRQMSRSPLHYYAALTAERKDTPLMRLGRVIDGLVFGGPQPVVYEGERRGNKWKEFQASVSHCGWCGYQECPITCPKPLGAQTTIPEIITTTEHDTARRCTDAILSHPVASVVLSGQRWMRLDWKFNGRDCRSHPDLVGDGFITDLKTSNNSDPHHFRYHALRMMYHAQLAFYDAACRETDTTVAKALYIVVAEYVPPFAVTVMQISEAAREAGARLNRIWMERLLVAEECNTWGGYSEAIEMLDLPENDDLFGLEMDA